jgi:hypothetical protein
VDWRPSSRVDYTERIKTERKKENVPNEPALRKKVLKILREKGGGRRPPPLSGGAGEGVPPLPSPVPFPPPKKQGEKGEEGEEGG